MDFWYERTIVLFASPETGELMNTSYLVSTPLEIDMEHNHGSLEDHFLSKRVISGFVKLPGCTA